MLDRKALRTQKEEIAAALARRGPSYVAEGSAWKRALALDEKQRRLKAQAEVLQAERNRLSKRIGQKKARGEDAAEELVKVAEIARQVKVLERTAKKAEEAFLEAMLEIPNPPHASVPDGESEQDNVEVRRWGKPRMDDVPPHWETGEELGILDFEAGARIAGSRFTVLRGAGARLARALLQMMLDMHVDRHGYQEVWPPAIVNGKALIGTGQLPKFSGDLYKIEGEDAYLIPTAEVPVTNLYRETILEEECLPIRHCAYTPCFRREAGSAGKDVRGMIRQHQFDKVELVQILHPDQALAALEGLVAHAEAVLQALELPYRVVELCAGDLGFAAEKTYDLEVWLPSQRRYREISSCSSFGQFQARRAGIRFRGKDGKVRAVATLNGSGVAIGRCIVALMENGWSADHSIRIPEALRPYMNGMDRIS